MGSSYLFIPFVFSTDKKYHHIKNNNLHYPGVSCVFDSCFDIWYSNRSSRRPFYVPLFSQSNLSIALAFHLMSALNHLFSVCNLCTIIFYVAILIETYLLIGVFKWKMKSRMTLMGKKNEIHSAKETRLVRSVIAVSVFYIATSLTRTMYER